MASDRSQVRPSWRPDASPSRLSMSSGSGWRRIDPATSATPTSGFSRTARLVLGLVGAVATYVAAIWVVLWLSPVRPAGVYLVGSGYQENLAVPHNVHGMNALAAVARLGLESDAERGWFSAPEGLGHVRSSVEPLGPEPLLKGELEKIGESTVLVYLTGQAGADAQGAFVFQDDRELLRLPEEKVEGSGKLYLRKLVRDLGSVPWKNFCLVLDVAIAPTNVPMGVIRNDFIAKLQELKPEIVKAKNLVVIAPASPGQRTWASDGWRQSVFGHFVAEALAGLSGDGRRVDSKALFAYVSEKVPGWTQDRRGDLQAPIMLPEADSALNLELAAVPRGVPSPIAEPETDPIPEPWKKSWLGGWQNYSQLKQTHPEAYAPALWTNYRAWLLRHEALARSLSPEGDGADKFLADVEKKLGELEPQIKAARQFGPKRSVDASLAMRAAWAEPGDRGKPDFSKLWDPKEAEKLTIDDRDRPAYYEALLDQLKTLAGPGDFARARMALAKLNQGTRPVEAHALAILLQDLPPGAADLAEYRELVPLALQAHRKAERIAVGLGSAGLVGVAYAEQVAPLVANARVAEADRDRRKAQDLLFTGDPGRWKQATRALKAANDTYAKADADADAWRLAVEARNLAFADLPHHGAWAARQATDETLFNRVLDAWDRAHAIGLALGQGPAAKDAIPAPPDLTDLAKQFLEECGKRQRVGVRLGDYDATLALIETPLLDDPARREAILKKLLEKPAPFAPGTSPAAPVPVGQVADRQARLALKALGPYGSGGSEGPAPALETRDEAARLALEGSRIGGRYRAMRRAVEPRPDENAPAILDRSDWLRKLDEQARLLVAGQLKSTDDPTLAYRQKLLQNLLLVLARRALDDHWFSENDQPESSIALAYFRKLADSLLDDVKRLSNVWAENPGFVKLKADLDGSARLLIEAPESPLVATDEKALGLSYRIEAPAAASGMAGRPVVWLTLDGDPKIAFTRPRLDVAIDDRDGSPPGRLGPGPASSRFAWPVNFAPLARAIEATGRAKPGPSTAAIRLDGRYRGQVLRHVTSSQVHPVPEMVVSRKPPGLTGDVVVRAEPALVKKFGGVDAGALVIVLDCSGSMGVPRDMPQDGPSKSREATRAIGAILPRITRGTRVSLWAFGQKDDAGSSTIGPRQTIAPILRPTVWDPTNPEMIDDLMGRIDPSKLKPWNESPIVRTMIQANGDFQAVRGFKSMLVLTDGKDTSFGAGQPKGDVADKLRQAFASSDVEINVVGYKIAEDESEDAVHNQFRVIREFRRPGEFYPIRQAEDLADALGRALRPTLRYSVQGIDNVRVTREVTLDNDPTAQGGFKELKPGGYKLAIDTGERRFDPYITIKRGDHLILQMGERPGGQIALSRLAWLDEISLSQPPKASGGWRLAALKSQKVGDEGLSLQAALEKRPTPDESALEVTRPREVWMEVKPGDDDSTPFQQRWDRIDAYPAPAWVLAVPSWPVARPRVSAWWEPAQEAEPSVSLPRADYRSFEELRERRVPLNQGEAVIEGLEFEDHPAGFDAADGASPGTKRLIIRARFPKGRRFWIKPQGFSTGWAEHRFYAGGDKYTGVFWPVTEDQVNANLDGLGLVSVDEFKARAASQGYLIRDLDAPLPTASDSGPPEASTNGTPAPLP